MRHLYRDIKRPRRLLSSGDKQRIGLILIAAILEVTGIALIPVFVSVTVQPATTAKYPLVGNKRVGIDRLGCHPSHYAWIPYWNAAVCFCFFAGAGYLVSVNKALLHPSWRAATMDTLTGLDNRLGFVRDAIACLALGNRYQHAVANDLVRRDAHGYSGAAVGVRKAKRKGSAIVDEIG